MRKINSKPLLNAPSPYKLLIGVIPKVKDQHCKISTVVQMHNIMVYICRAN